MERLKTLAFAILVVALIVVASPRAYAFEAEGEATLDFYSTYIWRGQNLGGNEGVIQPSIGFTAGNFGANLWSNYDSELGEHVETDLTVNYGRTFSIVSLEAGYIYYALDSLGSGTLVQDTSEVYLSLGLDTILAPNLTYYYDIDKGEGGFLVASVGHSFGLPWNMSLDLGLSASYCFDNMIMGVDSEGEEVEDFYNGEFSVAWNIPIGEHASISPNFAYTTALSHEAEDAIRGASVDGDSDIFYGGVGFALSF